MSGETDAFLASLATGDETSAVAPAEADGQEDDDYEPTPDHTPNEEASNDAPYDPAAVVAASPADTADDPSAGLQVPPQAEPRSSSHTPNPSASRKQVTIGGFVAEDSDEEAESTKVPAILQTSQALAVENVKPPSQAHTESVPVSSAVNALLSTSQGTAASAAPTPVNGASTPAPASAPSASSTANAGGEGNPGHATTSSDAVSLPKSRLPNDIIGQLEDRIADDPRGDVDAWLGLIGHLKSKGKYEEVRKTYGRLFEVFPSAADQWVAYARMELELDDLPRLEAIFNLSLLKLQSMDMWNIYIDHVRRRNDLATDTSGQGRQVVTQAYEFVINQVGQDKDSGQLWQDYISFIKSGPGVAGGTGWQDAQKMDLLRKAYQRAVCVPMSAVSVLWKEYDVFEMGLNKMTGRKFLQEKSPSYMTARSSFTALQNISRHIRRGIIPRLPPHPGCDGEEDYNEQVVAWQNWIEWEKEDPLVLKDDDAKAFEGRILFAYRQATMALRFYPRIWFEASQWCLDAGLEAEAITFLDQGIEANPESCLLAFRKADRLEATTVADEAEEAMIKRGKQVRAPYDGALSALYKHIDSILAREKVEIGRIEERYAALSPDSREGSAEPAAAQQDDEGEFAAAKPLTKQQRKEKEIEGVKSVMLARVRLTSRTLTYVWIALMRAMRRIQRKGRPGEAVGGMRGIFKEARVRGRLVSDFHIASALMEHHCYHDPAASKIFNLGMRLFPEDESFALAHVQFLISTGDLTNARAVFETTVSKLTANPLNAPRAKTLFAYFHDWESKYGELSQASKIESRMAELYPGEGVLELFAQRFGSTIIGPPPFDPCSVNLVLSPSQIRDKGAQAVLPSIETTEPVPIPQMGYVQSPKRPLDDSEAELPARKLIRGESPLKGAAGRRQQQRQAREGLLSQTAAAAVAAAPAGPKALPPAVQSLLSIIPPARQWDQTRFEPTRMVDLIRSVDMTKARMPSNVGPQHGRW